jgi:hypothetical protein
MRGHRQLRRIVVAIGGHNQRTWPVDMGLTRSRTPAPECLNRTAKRKSIRRLFGG